jgi:hypothetical protein
MENGLVSPLAWVSKDEDVVLRAKHFASISPQRQLSTGTPGSRRSSIFEVPQFATARPGNDADLRTKGVFQTFRDANLEQEFMVYYYGQKLYNYSFN